jgi:hypothetical protein
MVPFMAVRSTQVTIVRIEISSALFKSSSWRNLRRVLCGGKAREESGAGGYSIIGKDT